ncbi:MAG: adenylate kinase [Candidatus Parcubacteria bacterium]|nr:MAG: adenylate kinase [Candidatus Parcubacteria bacterium]
MKLKNTKVFFLTGPPVSGKDTQAKLLAKKIKGVKLTTSMMVNLFFKKYPKGYVKLGRKVFSLKKEKKRRLSGGLYSTFLVGYIVCEKLKEYFHKKNVVISGSPRLITEAKMELSVLNKNLSSNDYAFILLKVSEEEILRRAQKRRRLLEDRPEIVKQRIITYYNQILPVVDFLKRKNVLIEINGEGKVMDIHNKIMKTLISKGYLIKKF